MRPNPIMRVCLSCGQTFRSTLFAIEHGGAKYCSRPCVFTIHRPRTTLSEQFWPKVAKQLILPERHPEFGSCWLWTGSTYHNGYGSLTIARKVVSAHRVAYEMAAGPIPDGFKVLHTCDIHPCVRNDNIGTYEINGILRPRAGHLWLGTTAENMADMKTKGRSTIGDRNPSRLHPERLPRGDNHPMRLHPERVARGERQGGAKLTAETVIAMRSGYAAGMTCTALAILHGSTIANVWRIVQRETWRHLP